MKTPRVARSSLGVEAQAGGQASDAVNFTCRFWHHLLQPKLKLAELLEVPSTLEPIMVTDAKALYDSYHREGASGTVVDKRVSLEIRVMKERLQELNGRLRWMSSERQMADGLTKESARLLLAERLRHGCLKMCWDPGYVAAKKKSKIELQESLAASTARKSVPKKATKKPRSFQEEVIEYDDVPEEEYEMPNAEDLTNAEVPETLEVPENVYMVRSLDAVKDMYAASHIAAPLKYVIECRKPNVLAWLLWWLVISSLPCFAESEDGQCFAKDEIQMANDGNSGFGIVVALVLMLVFVLGRWSSLKSMRPMTCEAGVQKDEQLVPSRLREILKVSQSRCRALHEANVELDKALKLATVDMVEAIEVASSAEKLIRKCYREMEDHGYGCPYKVDIIVAPRHGKKWHHEGCNALDGTPLQHRLRLQPCQLCIEDQRPPPDREDRFFGGCLRDDLEAWLRLHTTWDATESRA